MGEIEIGGWQTGLDAGLAASVTELLSHLRIVDGRAPDGLPSAEAAVLLARRGTDVVGVAWREGDDPAELYVDPEFRRRGIGRRLADAALATGGVWAHGTFEAARQLADRCGASPVRRLQQMRRSTAPGTATPLPVTPPDGVTIRTFRPGADEAEFLGVNARAFAWHPEQGRLDAAGLRAEMTQPWFDPAGFFVAVDRGGAMVGFHWTKVHAEEPTPLGEVYVIGVDPAATVRHVGAPLLATGLNHLAERGLRTVLLYVEADNERAVALYERYGFRDYAVDTVFERQ